MAIFWGLHIVGVPIPDHPQHKDFLYLNISMCYGPGNDFDKGIKFEAGLMRNKSMGKIGCGTQQHLQVGC